MSLGYTNVLSITRKADADLSANQYQLVKATASNGCALAAANDRVLGVLQNKPNATAAEIQVAGIAKVKAGAAIAVGDYLKSDAAGKAITSTGEAVGTLVEIFGIALEAASALDDIITVLLTRVVINRAVS